jgi:chemotaxis protein CheC
VSATYNDLQLDALRELANIGAGNASTALSGMLGRCVDLKVPDVRVVPMEQAVEEIGAPESEVTGIALGARWCRPCSRLARRSATRPC